ncbi:MAG: hypothetical protein EOO41_03235 [Methanobacteriota archaeon]|nr:MAG: hypothetical protein EOO41_03235 [Euryarchaeota archaeon]
MYPRAQLLCAAPAAAGAAQTRAAEAAPGSMRATPRALPSPLAFAACVRAGVLAWSVLASLLTAGVQWDASQRVAYEAFISGATPRGKWDAPVQAYLAPLANWDGIHFTAIAERGYAYEQLHAFFPGWPLAMRSVAYVFMPRAHAARLVMCIPCLRPHARCAPRTRAG